MASALTYFDIVHLYSRHLEECVLELNFQSHLDFCSRVNSNSHDSRFINSSQGQFIFSNNEGLQDLQSKTIVCKLRKERQQIVRYPTI